MNQRSNNSLLQIAVDGLVATGKSSVGATVAQRLGILYFDTGVMYRAVALLVLESHRRPSSERGCTEIAKTMNLRVYQTEVADGRQNTICIGERDVTWAIRSDAVNHIVPQISAHPSVRRILISTQQHIAAQQPIVMVGRDIAATVLPHAQVKIRLTAPLDIRVRRRADELMRSQQNANVDMKHLHAEIRRRDEMDENNLSPGSDIVVINTESLTVEEVADHVVRLIPTDLRTS